MDASSRCESCRCFDGNGQSVAPLFFSARLSRLLYVRQAFKAYYEIPDIHNTCRQWWGISAGTSGRERTRAVRQGGYATSCYEPGAMISARRRSGR